MSLLTFIKSFLGQEDVYSAATYCPVCYKTKNSKPANWTGLCQECKTELLANTKARMSDFDAFPFGNLWVSEVTGYTYSHDGYNPQSAIPRLSQNERLYMIWEKTNEYDETALKIFNVKGEYLGWYPKRGYEKKLLLHLIENKYPFRVYVHDINTHKLRDQGLAYSLDIAIAVPEINANKQREQTACADSVSEKCKLCNNSLASEDEKKIGVCKTHALALESDINALSNAVSKLQPLINKETTPNKKLPYVKDLLEFLFEFKFKYINNGVEPLDQDIDVLIMHVLDAIPPDSEE